MEQKLPRKMDENWAPLTDAAYVAIVVPTLSGSAPALLDAGASAAWTRDVKPDASIHSHR